MKKILIIEDDLIIATVYGTKYTTAGFETRIAEDGELGLELLKTFKPDLVHLDLGVPKVNGAEVIRFIRSQPDLEAVPVVVLSNTYQNRLVKAAMDAGATECVSKATCTPKMMLGIVERLLARRVNRPAPPAEAEGPSIEPAVPVETAPPAVVSPAPDLPDSDVGREGEDHEAFHARIQGEFLRRAPELIAALRDRVEPLLRAETDDVRVFELSGLGRIAHTIEGHAGIAGFEELAQMSSALVALLKELVERPHELTPSALRTIVDACDFVAVLSVGATHPKAGPETPALVLVVDDDPLCRHAVRVALARLNAATIAVDDSRTALRLLAENRFSLICLDVEMPGLTGFELCKALRALPANEGTPVVFVTSVDSPESREQAMACGGNDLIAKPFLSMELAVKALSLLRRTRRPA